MKEINWRPTSVLPETKDDILLAIIDGRMEFGYYSAKSSTWFYNVKFRYDTAGYSIPEKNILGWLPLPLPPKEKII